MTARRRLAVFAAIATVLTSTSLSSVYADNGWFLPVLGVIVAVFCGGELGSRAGRYLLLGPFWRATGGFLALLVYVCAVYAPDQAWLHVVPTPSAVTTLRTVAGDGFADIRTLVAPVPTHAGLLLVTVGGVGLAAIAVDLLTACPPLTGLPLLALYSVPEWLAPHGTGPIPFILAAAGFLMLLVQEGRERTARWGRVVGVTIATTLGDRPPQATVAGALSATGRRLGAAALGIALVLPALLPGLTHPHLFGFATQVGGSGNGPVVTFNPITKIYGDLNRPTVQPLLAYRASHGTYLEFTTLDRFDNVGWSQSDLQGAGVATRSLPAPDLAASAAKKPAMALSVDVSDALDLRWLPLPPDTTRVSNLSDQWLYDGATRTVFSPHANTRGLSYDAVALQPAPGRAALENSPPVDPASLGPDMQRYLDLPSNVSTTVETLAARLTDAYSSPYLKAWALQAYFTGGAFTYDTHAPRGSGSDALANFVLRSRRGYCEQFATAMAAMARMVGIPARVAIGFTPGTRVGDRFVVTTADAHAWPELYFSGIGWLRFEPTPRGDGGASTPAWATGSPTASTPTTAGGGPLATTTQPPTTGGGTRIPNNIEREPNSGALPPLALPAHHLPSARTLAAIALAAAVLLSLAALPIARVVGRSRRHRRAQSPAEHARAAWCDVITDAADLGYDVPGSDSPRRTTARLVTAARLDRPAAEALRRLAWAEERARYAAAPPDGEALADVHRDAHLVSTGLRQASTRGARLRAALLPPSTQRRAVETVSTALGAVFAAVDAGLSALAARGAGRPRRGAWRGARRRPEPAARPSR